MHTITLQGIAFDEKSSFKKGARLAPPLIRDALYSDASNLFAENGASVKHAIDDKGDFEIGDYFEIEAITAKHCNEKNKVLTLGGDHSISFPIVKALRKDYPALDILHIDAHPDLYHEFEGDPYSHACPFARIMEHGLANRLVQLGIRTLNDHQAKQAETYGVELHPMNTFIPGAILKFDNPLYISLDMDAFDPAFAPGVSHREPGGFTAREVINLIQNIDAEVVGADIVEYNPVNDNNTVTAVLAAKMMKELLAKMMEK